MLWSKKDIDIVNTSEYVNYTIIVKNGKPTKKQSILEKNYIKIRNKFKQKFISYRNKKRSKNINAKGKESIYRQLKLASALGGDKYAEDLFKAKELKYLKKSLSWSSLDRFILTLNEVSNNFGINLSQSIGFTACVSIVFYVSHSIFLVDVGIEYLTLDNVFYHMAEWLQYFNLVRKPIDFSKVPELDSPIFDIRSRELRYFFSTFFDILGRVFTGFGIYQTITAFRRFGKK